MELSNEKTVRELIDREEGLDKSEGKEFNRVGTDSDERLNALGSEINHFR